MSYKAWNLWDDTDYWREQRAWEAAEDAWDAEEADHERDQARYVNSELGHTGLLPRAGT